MGVQALIDEAARGRRGTQLPPTAADAAVRRSPADSSGSSASAKTRAAPRTAPAPSTAPASETAATTDNVTAAVGTVTKYIPASVIGTYLTLTALLGDQNSTLLLIVFFAFWILAPLLVVAGAVSTRQRTSREAVPQSLSALHPWPVIAAFVAFAAWAPALPGSVLHTHAGWLTDQVGGALVVFTAFILPLIGRFAIASNGKGQGG